MTSAPLPAARTTWRQRLALLALGLLAVVLLLALAEWLLGVFGVQGEDRFGDPYVGFAASSSLFERVEAGDDGRPVWRTRPEKLRFFNQQEFAVDKPAGGLRVFTLGGSTTAGRPYDDHVSFSRWLERFLDQAEPDRPHEVVNAGAISYASYRVARLMDELVRYQPDLFVVLTGHNEFLEERSYREVRRDRAAVRWLRSRLARLRLARVAWSALGRAGDRQTPPATTLAADVSTRLEVWNGVQAYRRDDLQHDAVVAHFEFNLGRMADLARAHGVPILFVVPGSNLKDFSPFKSQHGDGVPAAEAARVESLAAADLVSAEELRQALAADPLYAAGWFRLGREELAAGDFAAAREAFEAARETDVAPLRAPRAVVEAVRALAGRSDVAVIDLPRELENEQEAQVGHRILGSEHFLDHVHPTLEVHRRIAEDVLAWMAATGLVGSAGEPAARAEIFERVLAELDREYYARRDLNLAKVLGWAGKLEEAEAPLLRAREVLTDEPALHLALGTLWQKEGRDAEARSELRRAVQQLPESPEAHFNLGVVEARLGDADEAVGHFETALALRDAYPEAQFNLGQVLRGLGRHDEAIRRLERANALSPGEARVIRALAAAYDEAGLRDEALVRFEALASEHPANAEVHYALGRLRTSKGQSEEAAGHYSRALELDPAHVLAHNNLGILLAGAGRWPEAVAHLRRATELDAAYAEAHLNLAVALDRSGLPAEAVRSARAALALRPSDPRIHLALAMLLTEIGDTEGAEAHLQTARDAGLAPP